MSEDPEYSFLASLKAAEAALGSFSRASSTRVSYTDNYYPTVASKVDPPILWLVARRLEYESQLSGWRTAGKTHCI